MYAHRSTTGVRNGHAVAADPGECEARHPGPGEQRLFRLARTAGAEAQERDLVRPVHHVDERKDAGVGSYRPRRPLLTSHRFDPQ
jgi:hypothetical protein